MKIERYCFKCQKKGIKKPIWKGNIHHRNFWGLYCLECEKEDERVDGRLIKQTKIKNRRYVIGCEDLEDGMIIEVDGDLEKAREIVNEMIDIHEVNKKGDIIDED